MILYFVNPLWVNAKIVSHVLLRVTLTWVLLNIGVHPCCFLRIIPRSSNPWPTVGCIWRLFLEYLCWFLLQFYNTASSSHLLPLVNRLLPAWDQKEATEGTQKTSGLKIISSSYLFHPIELFGITLYFCSQGKHLTHFIVGLALALLFRKT